jgi:hypothetical protein
LTLCAVSGNARGTRNDPRSTDRPARTCVAGSTCNLQQHLRQRQAVARGGTNGSTRISAPPTRHFPLRRDSCASSSRTRHERIRVVRPVTPRFPSTSARFPFAARRSQPAVSVCPGIRGSRPRLRGVYPSCQSRARRVRVGACLSSDNVHRRPAALIGGASGKNWRVGAWPEASALLPRVGERGVAASLCGWHLRAVQCLLSHCLCAAGCAALDAEAHPPRRPRLLVQAPGSGFSPEPRRCGLRFVDPTRADDVAARLPAAFRGDLPASALRSSVGSPQTPAAAASE